jgi:hypothetical protein
VIVLYVVWLEFGLEQVALPSMSELEEIAFALLY